MSEYNILLNTLRCIPFDDEVQCPCVGLMFGRLKNVISKAVTTDRRARADELMQAFRLDRDDGCREQEPLVAIVGLFPLHSL